MAYTVVNLTAGTIVLKDGTRIGKGKSKDFPYLTTELKGYRDAIPAQVSATLIATTPLLDNEIVANADAEWDIVDPTTANLSRNNDATLAKAILQVKATVDDLVARTGA